MARHKFSAEESRKGARAAASVKRRRRAEAQQLALERLTALVDPALNRLEGLLDSKEEQVALRAARDILDRALGRARQQLEVTRADAFDPRALSDAELEQLEVLLMKAESEGDT